MHCLLACVAERWLLNHNVTYFLGSKSLTGGPLMLIIIKLLTFANNSVDLLSVHTLFMRLKPLSHSAVLQGKVCIHRMSGFRLSGSLSGDIAVIHSIRYSQSQTMVHAVPCEEVRVSCSQPGCHTRVLA